MKPTRIWMRAMLLVLACAWACAWAAPAAAQTPRPPAAAPALDPTAESNDVLVVALVLALLTVVVGWLLRGHFGNLLEREKDFLSPLAAQRKVTGLFIGWALLCTAVLLVCYFVDFRKLFVN